MTTSYQWLHHPVPQMTLLYQKVKDALPPSILSSILCSAIATLKLLPINAGCSYSLE